MLDATNSKTRCFYTSDTVQWTRQISRVFNTRIGNPTGSSSTPPRPSLWQVRRCDGSKTWHLWRSIKAHYGNTSSRGMQIKVNQDKNRRGLVPNIFFKKIFYSHREYLHSKQSKKSFGAPSPIRRRHARVTTRIYRVSGASSPWKQKSKRRVRTRGTARAHEKFKELCVL